MATRRTTSMSLSSTDESRYRKEVLRLEEAETEDNIEERLVAEASELGLKIPDIQIAASLAATINAGILDLTIPAPPSASSSSTTGLTRNRPSFTHPRSFADLVRSSVASIDQLAGSLSETTISDRDHSGSIPSIDSLSTRPTSISSCDVRLLPPQSAPHERPSYSQSPQQISSPSSPTSTNTSISAFRLSDRKRSSFISAIGRPFRKRRTPSSVNLPPNAHISLKKNSGGRANTVIVETNPVKTVETERPEKSQGQGTLQVEVPVFDEAAIKRTKEDGQLKRLLEKHKAERARFVQFRNELLDSLKTAHLAVIAEKRLSNDRIEEEKKEWNTDFLARMEERQLSVEIDQIKEFERSKRNSQTRIKYMEGYVNTSSPPQSPRLSGAGSGAFESNSNVAQQQTLRMVTRRQKEQLAQEYLDRDSMDRLHEARIKVLRERQEQQLQETTTRLERELDTLISKNAEAVAELERDHQRAEQEMLQVLDAKKNQIRRRWNIEEAILRKKLEDQTGLPYGPLPNVSFSVPDDDDENDGDASYRNNNDREFLELEIPLLENPFARKDS
ncbi:conserved hypothetical protein [Talaromyces stipitatus ATCC 10500]|uniref:Uncharacterized protein n=1 Tax=Talaromyces stipitatus (strain ATCC 10500 / CBS 375.48 / QM 6759 / NRRL 1006) TaxID=441959 RepID=B8MMG2_TALSN|nr:uncharacterized protein TSTA_099660 [Talaromyces stipitatus ATCC 10500]EED13716.1 conserved hypothetical protein [Talaromyces stipitatus ATCC 10500]